MPRPLNKQKGDGWLYLTPVSPSKQHHIRNSSYLFAQISFPLEVPLGGGEGGGG